MLGEIRQWDSFVFCTSNASVLCPVPQSQVLFLTWHCNRSFWSKCKWLRASSILPSTCCCSLDGSERCWEGRHHQAMCVVGDTLGVPSFISTLTHLPARGKVTFLWSLLLSASCDKFWQWAVSGVTYVSSNAKHFVLGQDPSELSLSPGQKRKSHLYVCEKKDSPSNSLGPWETVRSTAPSPTLGLYVHHVVSFLDMDHE